MNIVELKNIKKTYNSYGITVRALDGISLTLTEGRLVVIMGRSGSGKTTLLNVAGGILPPDSGEMCIDGVNIYALKDGRRADIRNKKLGYIYQSFNLIKELNVLENIRLPFDIAGDKYDTERERAVFEMLEINDRLKFYPAQLSGGEQQRTAIARALVRNPALILADEPNGNLDSKTGRKLMEYVKCSNEEFGQTFLIVTHDSLWIDYADEVYILEDGKLISHPKGDPQ